ncbi:MAG: glycosyltransferase family 4 protein [Nitrosospira sp.]|nr:glycosyltransferase family 4 protein [Nitrosospira sp.]
MNTINHRKPISVIIATSIHPKYDKRIWNLCKGLSGGGMTVHLICPWTVAEGAVERGVIFHPFQPACGLWDRLFGVPRRIKPVIDALLPQASVLHVHDPDLLWLAARYRRRLVTVYDCHEYFDKQAKRRLRGPFWLKSAVAGLINAGEKALARRVGHVAVAAPGMVPLFSSRGIPALLVGNEASGEIMNTVRADWKERQPAIVYIGSQHEDNGSLLFLRIASLLIAHYPELKVVASDRFRSENYRKIYTDLAQELGLTDRLVLHPNVLPHQIMDILNQGTIAVSPNPRSETQLMANQTKLYEYMAAGLPIVCSDLPHQVRLIGECKSGLTARPEEPQSFANQISKLLDDDELRLRLGANAQRAFRDKYCYERLMPELIDFYRTAADQLGVCSVGNQVDKTS